MQDFQDVGALCSQPPLLFCLHFRDAALVKNAIKVRKDLHVYSTPAREECEGP